MFLHYNYNVDWTPGGVQAKQGETGLRDQMASRAKKFTVCCMLYGVCVFGALELYAACTMLAAAGSS